MLLGISANAQRIILDKRVRAGELTLFPDMEDTNSYYYLPDKLQLATDDNGKPQFSFLRFVENVRSEGGADEIREGIGGGIVHAVIELYVSPEQIQEARSELRKVNPEGIIQGPAMYNSGTFAIISSFANTQGDLTKQVVGIGKAPLIDGHKAAVSMELTKKGAKILWESFKTPTPDMSFSFEMELEGYSSPKKAIIEADFEKIYSHHGLQVGASGSYDNIVFGGEIELAFDELRNSGAIKIDNMGADEDMEKLIETAYNKLTTMMFDPIGGTGNPLVKDLVKSIAGKKSPIDRATDLYKQNKGSSAQKTPAKKAPAKSSGTKKTSMLWNYPALNDNLLLAYQGNSFIPMLPPTWEPKHIKELRKEWIRSLPASDKTKAKYLDAISNNKYLGTDMIAKEVVKGDDAEKPRFYFHQYLLTENERSQYAEILNGKKIATQSFKQLLSDRLTAIVNQQDFLNTEQKKYILTNFPPEIKYFFVDAIELSYIQYLNRDTIVHMPKKDIGKKRVQDIYNLKSKTGNKSAQKSEQQQAETKPTKPSQQKTDNQKVDDKTDKITDKAIDKLGDKLLNPYADEDKKDIKKDDKKKTEAKKDDKKADAKKKDDKKKEKKSKFKLAVMASYQFKKMKQTGKFKINLNKHTADKLVLRFDENIGQIDCNECFHQVNLDDPLFKQREIVAMIDGFNFDDFGKYINYASLKIKKTHQNGDITYDEVRIDRDNFVKTANNFKVLYGWKGDNNRTKWLDYEYQTQWSFFGGNEVANDWQTANANAINLAPPYLRKTIELEADPEMLKDKKVRSVNVKLFYKIGNKEEVKQISMLPSREQYSSKIDIMLPQGTLDYDYEISWRLTGNKMLSSGRQTTSESILFVDELGL